MNSDSGFSEFQDVFNHPRVSVTLFAFVPGSLGTQPGDKPQDALFSCDRCNNMSRPMFVVRSPDRDRPLLLGLVCIRRELARVDMGLPIAALLS